MRTNKRTGAAAPASPFRAAALFGAAAFLGSGAAVAADPTTGLAVAQIECVSPAQTQKLNSLRELIRRVTLGDNGAIVITMRDGAIVFVQSGAGCIVAMTPGRGG